MAAQGTPASEELAASLAQDQVEPDLEAVMIEAAGFMVVSQTSDIVRTCVSRPYVEVRPLLPINAGQISPQKSMMEEMFARGLASKPIHSGVDASERL
jgi:hypothetical protein